MPTWLWIVGGILLFFVLLLSASVRVFILADNGKVTLRIRYLFLSFNPLKQRKQKKEKKQKQPKPLENAPEQPPEGKLKQFKQQVSQVMQLLEPLADAVKKLLRGVRVRHFVLYLEVGKEDAAATAVEYGKLCALVYGAYGTLGNVFYIPDPDIRISTNYTEQCFRWHFSVKVKARLFLLLRIGVRFLMDLAKTKLSKENEGGVNYERDTVKRRHEHDHGKNQGND